MRRQRFVLAIVFMSCQFVSAVFSIAGESIESEIDGYYAANTLVNFEKAGNAIDLSPTQRQQLREVLERIDIQKLNRAVRITSSDAESSNYENELPFRALDCAVREEVLKILHPSQVMARRRAIVESKLRSPVAILLQPKRWENFGGSEAERVEVIKAIEPLKDQLNIKLERATQSGIERIVKSLSPQNQAVLVQFFGTKHLPHLQEAEVRKFNETSYHQIIDWTLHLNRYKLSFPKLAELEYVHKGITERISGLYRTLRREPTAVQFKEETEPFARKELIAILGEEKLRSIIQDYQCDEFERNVAPVLERQSLVSELHLNVEELRAFKEMAQAVHNQLSTLRTKHEAQHWQAFLDACPAMVRDRLTPLIHSVWPPM